MGMAALQLDLFQTEETPPSWSDEDLVRLCEAMIFRAIEELLHPRIKSLEQIQETIAWISTDTSKPFSFRFCCELCGFDPENMREAIADRVLKRNLASVRDLEKLGWL